MTYQTEKKKYNSRKALTNAVNLLLGRLFLEAVAVGGGGVCLLRVPRTRSECCIVLRPRHVLGGGEGGWRCWEEVGGGGGRAERGWRCWEEKEVGGVGG